MRERTGLLRATHHRICIPLTNQELALAADIFRRCYNRVALRTLEAIHLATCIAYSQLPLLTTDRVIICRRYEARDPFQKAGIEHAARR